MHFTVDLGKEEPSDWKKFLLKSEVGTIYHTAEYAEYAKKWAGMRPQFLRLLDSKGAIILQNLSFEYDRPMTKIPSSFRRVVQKFSKMIRWNYGPVTESSDALMFFFNYLKSTKGKMYGMTHPLMQLPEIDFIKEPWGTFLIDLHKSKDVLYENLERNSARKNIERSIERKVTIETMNESSLSEYYALLKDSKDPQQKKNYDTQEIYDQWNLLKKVGFTGFLARKDETPVGGLMFSYFNNYVNEWGVARSEIDTTEKLYAQDLIKWKIIEWGVDNKMNWYDLTGFNPNPTSKKEEGLLRYKKKWGGKQYGIWIIKR